jgi:ADP-ribosyl-[dinitrogen reductase] hydrolase
MPDIPLAERALGAYLGFALGDALGAPVEFMTAREIAHRYGTLDRMVGGGWLRLAPGAVTDDTTMALALGDAIVASGGWDLTTVAESFARWLRGKPIDCGNTCRRGIQRYLADGSLAGAPSDGDGGNGAAMRNLPVVLSTLGDDEAFTRRTIEQCHVTHHHRLSDAGTLALGRMTRILLAGGTTDDCRPLAQALAEAHRAFRFDRYPGRASGYIVDTVQTVLHHFFSEESYEGCVVAVANRGEDADTNAALAGMLAGARGGVRALPRRWLASLDRPARARIEAQTDALLALARGGSCG